MYVSFVHINFVCVHTFDISKTSQLEADFGIALIYERQMWKITNMKYESEE